MREHALAAVIGLLAITMPGDAQAQEAADLVRRAEAVAATAPAEAVGLLDEAYFAVWDRLPLAFRRTELVTGPAAGFRRYEPRGEAVFDAAEEVRVYIEPIGFAWRQTDEGWETDLVADFLLSTPDGRVIAGQKAFGAFNLLSPVRSRESFVTVSYRFSGVEPGDYVLTTTLRDRIDEEEASFDLPITVR